MMEDEIGEAVSRVSSRKVDEGIDAGEGTLLRVADQIDPPKLRGIPSGRGAFGDQPLRLTPNDRLRACRREVSVGSVAVGDPGVAVPGCERERSGTASRVLSPPSPA
jgi:hypothetical protein